MSLAPDAEERALQGLPASWGSQYSFRPADMLEAARDLNKFCRPKTASYDAFQKTCVQACSHARSTRDRTRQKTSRSRPTPHPISGLRG